MASTRSFPAWALVLLLLTPAAVAWTQAHGDGGRNAVLPLPPGPLDVLAVGTVPGGDNGDVVYTYAGAVLETPEGMAALWWREEGAAEECRLVTFDLANASEPFVRPIRGCRFGVLSAYHPPTGLLLVCANALGGAPLVSAYRPRETEPVWVYGQGANGAAAGGLCLNLALDVELGVVYAAVTSLNPQVASGVHAIDVATGRRLFLAPVTPLGGSAPMTVPLAPPDADELNLRAVTLTSTGFLVSGYTSCAGVGNPCAEAWAAWHSRDGAASGFERAASGKGVATLPGQGPRAGSQYAAANGPLAALVLGTEVLVVSPQTREPVLRAPLVSVEPPTRNIFYRGAAWSDAALVVQLGRSLRAFEPATLAPLWAWTEGPDAFVHDVYPAAGSFLVLAEGAEGPVIVKLAATTGRILERATLPLPDEHELSVTPLAVSATHPAPRLLVTSGSGDWALLGVADPALRPRVTISDPFPAPGAEVEILVEAAAIGGAPPTLTVAWGEDKGVPIEGSRARHVVGERGAMDVRVRAAYADGTTATTTTSIEVGGTPPPELTTLQRAFSPENQEITFFLLGTLITVVGLAITVGRHRRRYARLERELSAVEEIRMLSTSDPRGAVLSLKAYRDRLPDDLARRRIDDSQYQILDIRSGRLLKVLRTRLLAPYDARLSVRYHRQLDAAFEDAILHPNERNALIEALSQEPAIDDAARREIIAVLDDFTSERHDLL